MGEILFIQGAGKGTHDEWDNKLVASLQRELGTGYKVRYPPMPNEDAPTLASWKPVIEQELVALHDGAVVVGHSAGGFMLINVLAEVRPAVALSAIVLIASPYFGEGGWPTEEFATRTDFAECLPANVPVLLYHGESDEEVPTQHVALYAAAIPGAQVRRLAGRDHQLNNDLSEVARDIRELRSIS